MTFRLLCLYPARRPALCVRVHISLTGQGHSCRNTGAGRHTATVNEDDEQG